MEYTEEQAERYKEIMKKAREAKKANNTVI